MNTRNSYSKNAFSEIKLFELMELKAERGWFVTAYI